MTRAAIEALRADQQRALELFATLTAVEWQAPSGCAGWRVQDVAQHLASVLHSIAEPNGIEQGDTGDVERDAEVPVRARRHWSPAQVVAEYVEWSERGITALEAMQDPGRADTLMTLANLGSYPQHLLADATVFDHYCHLRLDIGAAVERAAHLERDQVALAASVEWMMAELPQTCASALAACQQGITLVFDDLAGSDDSIWTLAPDVTRWVARRGGDANLPTIVTRAHDFMSWGTKRADWRTLGIRAVGPAVQTLDAIDVT